jgi:transcriptional regulator with XRE-family HTH domain
MTETDITAPIDDEPQTSGERLIAARELAGKTLKAVASDTKQSLETLKALEAMETSHISDTVLRMQAMAYARYLGLPEREIASGYVEQRSAANSANMPNARFAKRRTLQRSWLVPTIAVAGIICAAMGMVWLMQPTARDASQTPVADLIALPPIAATPLTSEANAARQEISVRALKVAWIEVRGSDGTIFRSRNMSRGEVYFPRMDAGWTLTVRDGAAFEWVYADIATGPIGETGQPVYSVNIDAVTKEARSKVEKAMADAAVSVDAPR